MKTLYLECSMGAAGDMLAAALLELCEDREGFMKKLAAAGLEGVRFKAEPSVKCGITGTHMRVTVNGSEEDEHLHEHDHHHEHEHDNEHEHHHHHAGMEDIRRIVEGLNISEKVRSDVLAVYGLIAEAESHVHGRPVTEIHFHEVGTMDAVADITAVCMLMEELAPDRVVASPVHVGSGSVRCAHGILPVPAPATAYILRDAPIRGGDIEGELCTPTGAALLKYFADDFGPMPAMRLRAMGCGMGRKDFPQANCLRAMLGDSEAAPQRMWELSCNVDDMTAEDIAFACGLLLEGGANEVYSFPVSMKKNRTGTVITLICTEEKREALAALMFRHTTTLGIRETAFERRVMERRVVEEDTPLGPVRKKLSEGFGVRREKYEHDDLERLARERGLSVSEVRDILGGK